MIYASTHVIVVTRTDYHTGAAIRYLERCPDLGAPMRFASTAVARNYALRLRHRPSVAADRTPRRYTVTAIARLPQYLVKELP